MNKFWVHFFEHSIRELCQGKRRTRHIFAKFIIHSTGEKWGKILFKATFLENHANFKRFFLNFYLFHLCLFSQNLHIALFHDTENYN